MSTAIEENTEVFTWDCFYVSIRFMLFGYCGTITRLGTMFFIEQMNDTDNSMCVLNVVTSDRVIALHLNKIMTDN